MRLRAIDWLRGLVMILMTLDHASEAFNAGRLMTDATFMYAPGTKLPVAQFLTRWVTHLCAPTFVLLAGASIAFAERKDERIDRFLVTRGLFIAAMDPLWMSWVFTPGSILLQVLYAIGTSFVLMAPLRRLPSSALIGLAVVIAVGGELAPRTESLPIAMLLTGGFYAGGRLIIGYPTLPWLAIMMAGLVLGRTLVAAARAERALLAIGGGMLALFAVVRGANGFGNMGLLREDGTLVQWLHVSKYPPSISFIALECGLALVILGFFLWLDRTRPSAWAEPLAVFGRTAFFFYLVHAHLLRLAAWLLGKHEQGTLLDAYIAWIVTVIALYPACIAYGALKRARPRSVLRYV